MTYTLYGQAGFGSVCVEAALELLGAEYDFIDANPLGDADNRARVAAINPVGQVPALVLPGGAVMTESAAILIYLGDLHPASGLAPAVDAPQRADYLRWLLFLASSLYSTFTISDGPERFHPDPAVHDGLLAQADERRKVVWGMMNAAFKGRPGPYLLGASLTMLDVYTAMMSRWDPGRDWFDAHCPALLDAVLATEKHPAIQRVWARNYRIGDAA